jgi:hypothetical protein
MLEEWSDGMLDLDFASLENYKFSPIAPIFHYSIIPLFLKWPGLPIAFHSNPESKDP